MEGNQGLVNSSLAKAQWEILLAEVEKTGAKVQFVAPQPNLPDLVFTANGGFVWNGSVALPRFASPERRGEEFYFRSWFEENGYELRQVPDGEWFEGEGDLVPRDSFIFMGCHSRTTPEAAETVRSLTGLEVVPLRLNPKGYYHLDTCMFTHGRSGKLFYCPEAFTPEGRDLIVDRIGASRLISITLEEASYFACNTVILGETAISPTSPPSFVEKVTAAGLKSVTVNLGEFMKAGGASKCLILHLQQPA